MKHEALQVFREERKNFCRGNREKFMRTWHLVKPPWTQEVWHAEREGDEAEAGDDQRSRGRDATACGMHRRCAWFGEKGQRERVRGGMEAWPDLEGNEAFERSAKKIKIK